MPYKGYPTTTISSTNSTNTALANGGIYTGEWEDVSVYDSIIIAAKTDQNGKITLQFSPDGENIDSSLVRYYRTNQIEAPHRFTVTRRFCRVLFENTSLTTQEYLRLQTVMGFKTALNAPIDSVLSQDFDATPVRPTEYKYEVAQSIRQGAETWNKFGYDSDVGLTNELLAEFGGTFTPITTATTLSIVSTDADDADGDTGAHGVVIYGVDADREEQIQVVLLTGTTPVVTTTTWLGINRMALYRSGSSLSNEGAITATAVTGGSTLGKIPVGLGATQQCVFYTSASHIALFDWLFLNANRAAGGGTDPIVDFFGYVYSSVSNSKYEVLRISMDTTLQNFVEIRPSQPFVVGEKSVFWLEVKSNKTGTSVSARFSGVEIRQANAAV